MNYQFIAAHDQQYRVTLRCPVLGVVGRGYYRWCRRPLEKRKLAAMILSMPIKDIFKQSRDSQGRYGLHATLVDEGVRWGRQRVARLVRANNLEAKAACRFKVVTTDSKHRFPVAPHILEQNFTAEGPDRVWLSDIPSVPTTKDWLYLAAVMDLYARRIVGWAMSDSRHRPLTLEALPSASRCQDYGPLQTKVAHRPVMRIRPC